MVEALGRGIYRITGDRGQRIAYVAGPPDARWVFLEGQTFLVDVSSRGGRPRSRRPA